jgi:hypothetical protein
MKRSLTGMPPDEDPERPPGVCRALGVCEEDGVASDDSCCGSIAKGLYIFRIHRDRFSNPLFQPLRCL